MARILSEYKKYLKNIPNEYSLEMNNKNIYEWTGILYGPQDSPYENGIFRFKINFPKEYPNKPPEFKFLQPIFHPNIYVDGKVCISILHQGADQFGYEKLNERWNPTHSAYSVIISIINMLAEPNDESPANVDAAVLWRNNKKEFNLKVYGDVKKSQLI
jgi:ubiquitin-protein ligase